MLDPLTQHLKKFENFIYKAINQGQGMKQTDVVSIKGGEIMKTLSEMKSGLHRTQDRELFEKTLDDDEIESLIDKKFYKLFKSILVFVM